MTESNTFPDSPEWVNARKDWWNKSEKYKEVLETSTKFYELEKALYILDYLREGSSSLDCCNEEVAMRKEMLDEACLDAELNILKVCSEFAKKKASLDVAREEMEKAKKVFDDVTRLAEDELHMPEYRSYPKSVEVA